MVPVRQMIGLCAAFVGFVVFNNLSLQFNSVGFYQLMKVLTTPAIVLIQYVLYSVNVHNNLKLALLPVCIGVAMATVSDVEMNFWGTFHAVCGILSTSFYQIWVKSKQQDLQLNSYQLLFLQVKRKHEICRIQDTHSASQLLRKSLVTSHSQRLTVCLSLFVVYCPC